MNEGYVLIHHGVKGMKWGVRKDYDIVSAHKRNQSIKKAKLKYLEGKITKSDFKSAKKAAKSEFRNRYKTLKNETKGMSKEERAKRMNAISKTRIKDIPHSNVLKGAHIANTVLTGLTTVNGVSSTLSAAASMAMIGTPIAAVGMGAVAGLAGTAIGVGASRAFRRGVINALS